jgi:hypothetical protein
MNWQLKLLLLKFEKQIKKNKFAIIILIHSLFNIQSIQYIYIYHKNKESSSQFNNVCIYIN